MQRVHPAVLDRAPRRHERLPGHLAAEDPLALLVGLDAPEDVDLNGFEVKQVDEELQGRRSWTHVRRPPRRTVPERLPAAPTTLRADRGQQRERDRLPGRLPLGRRHRGAPDRGRQRQQRLVGVGAQSRVGHARAERRRLRLVAPLARGRRARRRHGPRRLPLLARVEPHRAGRGRVLASPRSSTTGASAPRCHGHGIVARRHLPPLHDPAVADGPGRVGGARRARALRPVRRAGHRRTSATSSVGPAPSTSPTSSASWGTSRVSTRRGSRTTSPATAR